MTKIIVSGISISPIHTSTKGIVAFVDFVLDGIFCVRNAMIGTSIKRKGEYRLIYPSQLLPNNKRIQNFYPIKPEAGQMIEKQVIEYYEKFLKDMSNG